VKLIPNASCPACGRYGLLEFHRHHRIPTNSCLLLADRDEAESFPRGELRLAVCEECGFVTNTAFDPGLSEYSSRYEETQGFSATFVEFGKDLARRWVERYSLQGKSVLEIGCGKGEFLTWMVEAGAGRGIGIDPGVHPEWIETDVADRLEWHADFYGLRYADVQADAIVCRHTLEHISPVYDFMRLVRATIGDRLDTVILFELPDVKRVLDEAAFWDVYYEHCSYFSAGSLARLFRRAGFEVLNVELEYDDQYIILEARPVAEAPAVGAPLGIEEPASAMVDVAKQFEIKVNDIVGSWADRIAEVVSAGGSTVVWGAGSKGVSFLTTLESQTGSAGMIDAAVDINPRKAGMFMAGTGHEIVLPSALVDRSPNLVVAMNPVYLPEIGEELARLGVDAELLAV
jgi:SAM-dependent methyltransferase